MKLSVASSLKDSDFLNPRSVRPGERMGIASPGHTQASKTAIPNTNSIQTSTPLLSQTRNPLPGHASSTNQNIPPTIHHSYDVISIQNQHQEEHADTGLHVRLSKDDLDRLHLILQAPLGGFIDDPPLDITEIIPHSASADLVAYGGVLLEDLENELKKHLVAEIVQYNQDTKDPALSQITNDFQSLSLADTLNPNDSNSSPTTSFSNLHRDETSPEALDGRSTRQPKSLRIYNCHHTTILRKSNSRKEKSSHPPSFSTYGDTQPMVSLSIPRASHASYAFSGKLHDLTINACSDSHIYLLQSFEHVTISECTNCTIVIGAVAGLMHVLDCERTKITVAARRIVVNNCSDVLHYSFTPNKPLLVGDNRSCQFAPYNTYYEGLREDLLATALAAIKVHPHENDSSTSTMTVQHMVLSKNMWKIPEDLTKLEMTQAISQLSPTMSPSSLSGSLNSGMDGSRSSDDMMQTPIILPPNEFHILYVPVSAPSSVESSSIGLSDGMTGTEDSHTMAKCGDSPYCRFLADVLSLSPLRLPAEYERQAISKVEKVRALQQVILSLTLEQQVTLEDDLNRMFRDWLVNSGNLRQVLDLVHILK
jgi:TBCC domain-containing protein 1